MERGAAAAREAAAPPTLGAPLWTAFAVSGVAGLIYELTWTRYLALLVGHSAFAQVLVLAVYLGGTALGSLLVAERSRSLRRPLNGYAAVEVGLGVLGILFPLLYRIGTALLYRLLLPAMGEGTGSTVAIWSVAVLLILPQAILLGATFPLMAAGVVRRLRSVPGRSVANIYLLNTLGGALGVLLGGFALVPLIGLPGAAAGAGLLNLTAAWLAWKNSGVPEQPLGEETRDASAPPPTIQASVPLLLMATLGSALASFMYEIGWIRMLALVLGSATHAFELMLSAFLVGLGLGSLLIRRWADGADRPVRLLGAVQIGMGIAALLTLPIYQQSFPLMSWLVGQLPKSVHGYWMFNLSRYGLALLVMLPATLFAGMTLPLITGTLIRAGAEERVIGRAYSANTLGSVLGAVMGGMIVMPRLGLEGVLALGASLDMVVGVALLAAAAGPARRRILVGAGAGALSAAAVLGVVKLVRFDEAVLTSGVYRSGVIPQPGAREMLYYKDGATATIGAHRILNGQTIITTNGKPDASLPLRWLLHAQGEQVGQVPFSGEGDETTQVLAPLITLAHVPDAKRAIVIGQGSGISSQTLLGDPELDSVVTIEIEPAMIEGSKAFMPANRRTFEDPRARFLIADARSSLAEGGPPLDLVFSGPSNPWVSGVASLFTVDFYRLVLDRLSDKGVFGQWIHLYEMEDELVLSVLAGIDQTFPDWNAYLVSAADILVVAGKNPIREPDWTVAQRPGIAQDLAIAPPLTPGSLGSLLLFDHRTLGPMLQGMRPNTDERPLLDERAERARFLEGGASGVFTFADHPVNLPRILSRIPLVPVPYDPPAIVGITPLERRSMAGWLATEGRAGGFAPIEEWDSAREGLRFFEGFLRAKQPPSDWKLWFDQFYLVEQVLHGRAAGWIDETFYREVGDYLLATHPPMAVTASVALVKGLRALDLDASAAAADQLRVTDPTVTQLLPPDVILDAAVAAYLGAGQPEKARAAFDRLAPLTGRAPGHVRNRAMDALIDAALGR